MSAQHNCLLTLLLAATSIIPWSNSLIAQQATDTAEPQTTDIARPQAADTAQPQAAYTDQPTLPPELAQHLARQLTAAPTAIETNTARLAPRDRLLLAALAVGILLIGSIICRYAAAAGSFGGNSDSIFLILGVFCGIAALCIACSVVATLRLHLAATICTILSGFCIGSFWLSQFAWAQQLLLPTRRKETR